MTRYEAYIDKRWREHGLAQVVVVRRRDNGLVDFGVFQVDLWCLGVRDAARIDSPGLREKTD